MSQVTRKQLEAICRNINAACGTPEQPYAQVDGKWIPQARCYHLSGAYGGVALHQMCDEGSGVRDIFGGHMPKRELANRMYAFLRGIEVAKSTKVAA